MDPILNDKRFAKLATDKKFRSVGKKHKKVEIDKRFGALFTNKNFVSKCTVDKRGRPKNLSAKESYEKFYQLEDDSSSDDDQEEDEDNQEEDEVSENEEKESEEEKDEERKPVSKADINKKIKSKLLSNDVDYARGEGNLYSDSSSEEDSDSDEAGENVEDDLNDDEDPGSEYFDKWGELDADSERTEEATERLALCNMDWDRVGAEDIYLLLSSFCPPSGSITNVKIFLSDFGKERLEDEKEMGPRELRRLQGEDSEEDDVDPYENNKKTFMRDAEAIERVRQYQINRLKYYYAVATFDSVQTASKVYDECDGMEYELSATRLDLRFIPGDMEFSAEPESSCLSAPDPDKYQPKVFSTTALTQGKVELTWDEEDQDKMKAMKDAYSKVDDEEFGNMSHLIGSASESEEEEENENDEDNDAESDKEDTISKYRALLAHASEKETRGSKGGMEMTWNDEDVTEDAQEELTPWEKYLQKKKDKKKGKKVKSGDDLCDDSDEDVPEGVDLNDPFFAEELGEDYVKSEKAKKKKDKKKKKPKDDNENEEEDKKLGLMVMDSDDEKDHFDFKHIVEAENQEGKSKKKKWRKKKKELDVPAGDNFSVDVEDNRFSAMFSQPDYNIDPTNPSFKKTKNMEKIIGEKQKRITSGLVSEEKTLVTSKKPKLDPELSQALKSVKNKWNKNAKKKNKLKFTVTELK